MSRRSNRNYVTGESSSSREGCNVKPSDPSGNQMDPFQDANHFYPIQQGCGHMYPLQHMNPLQHVYPLQHSCPLQGGSGNRVIPTGGNQMDPFEGANHLYPTQLGGDHMYPLRHMYPLEAREILDSLQGGGGGGNRMIPIGGDHVFPFQGKEGVYKAHETTGFADGKKLVINVIPPPPLPIFCSAPPRSSFLESIDNKTEWVKLRGLSDEEHSRLLSKAFHKGGCQANKPSPSRAYSQDVFNEYL